MRMLSYIIMYNHLDQEINVDLNLPHYPQIHSYPATDPVMSLIAPSSFWVRMPTRIISRIYLSWFFSRLSPGTGLQVLTVLSKFQEGRTVCLFLLFCFRMSSSLGSPDVSSWLDSDYAFFGRNTTEAMLCSSWCIRAEDTWCWFSPLFLMLTLFIWFR